MLTNLQKMYDELMTVNSKLAKLEILKKYPENKEILFYIYHPMYVYGVTSANLKKNPMLTTASPETFPKDLLDKLRLREYTGHEALSQVNGFIGENREYTDLIYKIMDRNLKAQIGTTEINKVWPGLIPVFDVQLAATYITKKQAEKSQKLKKKLKETMLNYSEVWYSSRKLDGLRCVTIMDETGDPKFFSRSGKEFFTLDVLRDAMLKIPINLRINKVFDGELCIIDEHGDENFKSILKLGRKKDYTIPKPHYKVFDYLPLEDFNAKKGTELFDKRYMLLRGMEEFNFDTEFMTVPLQIITENNEHLDIMTADAIAAGWEGLIVRKNVPYKAKRSKNMFKVKPFFDDEFFVIDIEMTEKNMLNENGLMVPIKCMGTAFIEFKGSKVGVGSGWSDEERIAYGDNPERLIGKEITVRYTEESENEEGKPSLRFPRKKAVYENGRED